MSVLRLYHSFRAECVRACGYTSTDGPCSDSSVQKLHSANSSHPRDRDVFDTTTRLDQNTPPLQGEGEQGEERASFFFFFFSSR